MACGVNPGAIIPITPSDSAVVEGVSSLLVTVAGNLSLKGTQTGAAATAAFAVTVGMQIYVPGKCIVMATNTTATVVGMG